jgi:endonuclease-3
VFATSATPASKRGAHARPNCVVSGAARRLGRGTIHEFATPEPPTGARAPDSAAHEANVNATKRQQIFERLREAIPAPKTELQYESAFELLIAVILSAQATDVSVNLATRNLFPIANTPAAMVALGVDGLTPYIRHIGLFNNKARNVIATCAALLERHGGEVPRERAALEALPGVGRKTANVVLNAAFGEPTIAVDTHVFRVANRTRIAPGKTVNEVEARLIRSVPAEFKPTAHHLLILHGRHVCTARKPHCVRCPIRDWCEYPHKTGDD